MINTIALYIKPERLELAGGHCLLRIIRKLRGTLLLASVTPSPPSSLSLSLDSDFNGFCAPGQLKNYDNAARDIIANRDYLRVQLTETNGDVLSNLAYV